MRNHARITPRCEGRPTANPAVDGSTRTSSRSSMAIGRAMGEEFALRGQARLGLGHLGRERRPVHRLGAVQAPERRDEAHPLLGAGLPLLDDPHLCRRHRAADTQHLDVHLDRTRGCRRQEVRPPGEDVRVARTGEARRGSRGAEGHEHPSVDGVPDQPALAEVPPCRADGARRRRRGAVPRELQHLVELAHGRLRFVVVTSGAEPMVRPMRSIHWPTAVLVAGTMLLLWLAVWLLRRSRRRGFLSEVDRATYATLHTAPSPRSTSATASRPRRPSVRGGTC